MIEICRCGGGKRYENERFCAAVIKTHLSVCGKKLRVDISELWLAEHAEQIVQSMQDHFHVASTENTNVLFVVNGGAHFLHEGISTLDQFMKTVMGGYADLRSTFRNNSAGIIWDNLMERYEWKVIEPSLRLPEGGCKHTANSPEADTDLVEQLHKAFSESGTEVPPIQRADMLLAFAANIISMPSADVSPFRDASVLAFCMMDAQPRPKYHDVLQMFVGNYITRVEGTAEINPGEKVLILDEEKNTQHAQFNSFVKQQLMKYEFKVPIFDSNSIAQAYPKLITADGVHRKHEFHQMKSQALLNFVCQCQQP